MATKAQNTIPTTPIQTTEAPLLYPFLLMHVLFAMMILLGLPFTHPEEIELGLVRVQVLLEIVMASGFPFTHAFALGLVRTHVLLLVMVIALGFPFIHPVAIALPQVYLTPPVV